jgi:hypothetical protein
MIGLALESLSIDKSQAQLMAVDNFGSESDGLLGLLWGEGEGSKPSHHLLVNQ